jgi:hypothetical protein
MMEKDLGETNHPQPEGETLETRNHWPHLVGHHSKAAEESIRAERPDLKIVTVPHDSMVTMDFRTDRVRIFVDNEGKVARPPRVG